jgi:catechol 2,3-dioxygenase-like lactoylglutathione lyase family enzyme
MLSAIVAVTHSVPDLNAAEQAYAQWLSYRTVEQGLVSRETASAWGAPLAEGRRYAVMQPASGEPVYLRLVQSPPTPGYEVMKTHGWNSNEILVQDPDALAARFAAPNSPFRVIGPPRPLASNAAVRAMQAIGPAGELNYFTRIPPDGGALIRTPARSEVDRTFIVVLGGPDMDAMRRFYGEVIGATVTAPYATKVNVLQDAYGLPPEHLTTLALVTISPGFLIELDEYPTAARPRPIRAGDLPPGMAIVSFAVSSLDARALPWAVPPARRAGSLYGGRRSGTVHGAAGEWIELIESPEQATASD